MSVSLASLVRGTRLSQHLTIEELSQVSGVAERTISDIERGVSRGPRRRTVEAIADGLRLSDEDRAVLLAAAAAGRTDGAASTLTGTAPLRLSDFVGRTDEVRTIVDALDGAHGGRKATVVVSGAPGFGKTTVAVEALAHARASDVSSFAGLGGTTAAPRTPLETLRGLLQQLPGQDGPAPRDLDQAAERWRAATRDRRVAVLLDDAADEAQVRPVLTALGDVLAVVTSRRLLAGLDDVTRVVVEPFDRTESTALLRRIVPEAQTDDAVLDDLVALCGSVPLALRIAGNRLASRPSWTMTDLVLRLRDERGRIRNLAVGDRAVESAFAVSYRQLDEVTRRLFRRLSIIDGQTFTPELVASFAGCDPDVAEAALDVLADLSLLQAMSGGRFRLHDLLRVFANDQLLLVEGAERAEELRGLLHAWLLRRTASAGTHFAEGTADDTDFADRTAAADWLRTESAHWVAALRAAADRGSHRTVVDTAEALHWFSDIWPEWGRWHEVFGLAAQAARALDDPRVLARQLGYVAWAQIVELGDLDAAADTADRALAAADRSGDVHEVGWARFYVQWAAMARGDHRTALAAAERNVEALAGTDHLDVLLNSMRNRGIALSRLGDEQSALRAHLAVLARAEQVDDSGPFGASAAILRLLSRGSIARSYVDLGDGDTAIDWATFAMELSHRLGYRNSESWGLATRAMALEQTGRTAEALRDARAALELAGDNGDPLTIADAEGVVARLAGDGGPGA